MNSRLSINGTAINTNLNLRSEFIAHITMVFVFSCENLPEP